MKNLTISVSDQLLLSVNMDTNEFIFSIQKEYGLKMYREGKWTLNQSAEFCGMNLYDFMSLLTLSGIPVINYNTEELENELKQFEL